MARGQDGDNAVEVGGTIFGDRLVKYDRGGGRTRRKVKRPPNQRADPGMTLNVSIDYAETRWVLKVVESDISYLANGMVPSSETLLRMSQYSSVSMLHSVKMSGREAKEAAIKKKAKDDR